MKIRLETIINSSSKAIAREREFGRKERELRRALANEEQPKLKTSIGSLTFQPFATINLKP